jgi:hypothetical protein
MQAWYVMLLHMSTPLLDRWLHDLPGLPLADAPTKEAPDATINRKEMP